MTEYEAYVITQLNARTTLLDSMLVREQEVLQNNAFKSHQKNMKAKCMDRSTARLYQLMRLYRKGLTDESFILAMWERQISAEGGTLVWS